MTARELLEYLKTLPDDILDRGICCNGDAESFFIDEADITLTRDDYGKEDNFLTLSWRPYRNE